jgi:DNA-binding IscR family transcriptional regulator
MKSAATQLRSVVLSKEDGEFLGDEREVIQLLGVSRATLRQVARLLEREGLLAVKRGSNGGYYARRPCPQSVEAAVIDYLEVLDVGTDELSIMASTIWIEAVRQAANSTDKTASAVVTKLTKAVRAVDTTTLSYVELIRLEQRIRADVLSLVDMPYMKFMFQITLSFGEKRFSREESNKAMAHVLPEWITRWREVKLLELSAIAHGDQELAVMAAGRSRDLWRTVSQFQRPDEKA